MTKNNVVKIMALAALMIGIQVCASSSASSSSSLAQASQNFTAQELMQQAENLKGKTITFQGDQYKVTDDSAHGTVPDSFFASRWITLRRPDKEGSKVIDITGDLEIGRPCGAKRGDKILDRPLNGASGSKFCFRVRHEAKPAKIKLSVARQPSINIEPDVPAIIEPDDIEPDVPAINIEPDVSIVPVRRASSLSTGAKVGMGVVAALGIGAWVYRKSKSTTSNSK